MTLYRENPPGAFSPWRGERIGEGENAISYPLNIEQLWSPEELEAIGLWRDDMIAPADPLPEGKMIVSTAPQRVDGVVKFVHELEDAPVTVPQSVTMRQARLALLQAGLLANVEAAIDAMPEPERTAARIEWEYAAEMKRDHALIQNLAAGLGLSAEQVDNLFQVAVEL